MIRRLLAWLRDFEPAEFKALITSIVGILATVGVSLSTDVLDGIEFWTGVVIVVLTQVQAILTRFGVFAPATVERIREIRE